MIEPATLQSLNTWYSSVTQKEEKQALVKEGHIENIKIILEAEELWQEIKPQIESSDFYQIVINGSQGSGKTTTAKELAHHAHSDGFYPIYSSAFDILTAPVTFVQQAAQNPTKKVCIVMDDMSYAMGALSSKTQSKLKNFIGMLRHALNEGGSVKPQIFLIVITHLNTGVPPILKNSNVWIFSKPTPQEYDYMIKIVGRKRELRQKLEIIFEFVKNIQAAAKPGEKLELGMYGYNYEFVWNLEGRLAMIIKNGEAQVYHSQNVECDECEHIGKGIVMNAQNYMQKEEEGAT